LGIQDQLSGYLPKVLRCGIFRSDYIQWETFTVGRPLIGSVIVGRHRRRWFISSPRH
jgi:hypothetical protein